MLFQNTVGLGTENAREEKWSNNPGEDSCRLPNRNSTNHINKVLKDQYSMINWN